MTTVKCCYTAHFGIWQKGEGEGKARWVIAKDFMHAQMKKVQRRRKRVAVECSMLWGELEAFKTRLQGLGMRGIIQTAFIERVNLTVRQSVAPLIRRTWSTSIYPDELGLHLEWWRAYYHFARYHSSLRIELAQPEPRKGRQQPRRYRSRTPAMAAGLSRRRWTVMELLSYPLPEGGYAN